MATRVLSGDAVNTFTAAAGARRRFPLVDGLRGSAIVLMFVYHFCYDLNYFGYTAFAFNTDPFWLNFRTLIVTLFLGTVGISLHLATRRGLNGRAFLRRLGLLVLYAGLISAVSYIMFPRSMIFFGVLHFIAVASVLGLLFTRFYRANLALGLGLIALGVWYRHPAFDHPALQWLGLMTHKPLTEDYVPLLPWFGVVLLGVFIGKALYGQREVPAFALWQPRATLGRVLTWGGRHSLHIYMLHQPAFMGLLFAVGILSGRG